VDSAGASCAGNATDTEQKLERFKFSSETVCGCSTGAGYRTVGSGAGGPFTRCRADPPDRD